MNDTQSRETDDPILQEDLEHVARSCESVKIFKDSTVFITGCTGLLGSLLIRQFLCINRVLGLNISLIGFARNEEKAKKVFSSLYNSKKLEFIYGDIAERPEIPRKIDYIIHTVGITASADMVSSPVELINATVNGTMSMLELARKHSVKGFLFLSSMEAFGRLTDRDAQTYETSYGYLDPNNVRNCYPESKRMAECLCHCYAKEYCVPTFIARLAQTIGAGISYLDTKVPAQFARSIIDGKDIVLHTKGDTTRNIVYTRDALSAIFCILSKGSPGEVYNVANKKTAISIAETASILIHFLAHDSIKLVFDLSDASKYPQATHYNINTDKLEGLGWHAEVDLIDSYRRMIESMRNIHEK